MSTGIVAALNKSVYHVQVHLLLSVASTLAMEVNGLPFSRRVDAAQQARELCGSEHTSKQGVLRDYVQWMNKILPGGYEPSRNVAKALAE